MARSTLELDVASMPLDRFARAGLVIKVRSEALGCSVIFASDNSPRRHLRSNGLAVYRASELAELTKMGKDAGGYLRRIHEVKTVFRVTVEAVEPHPEQGRLF